MKKNKMSLLLLAALLSGCNVVVNTGTTSSSKNNESTSKTSETVSSSVNKTSSSTSSLNSSTSSKTITNTYTISFKTNSSQIIEPLVYEENQTVYLEDLPILLDRDDLSTPKFVCWTNEDVDVINDFVMPSKDIELVAKWRAYEVWTIKYETNIPGYTIEDTVVSEKNGLDSYSLPAFAYPYKKLSGWYYDSSFTQEVGTSLNENLFTNREVTLYAKVEDTDVSASGSWVHNGNEYIGRGYTQVKNVGLSVGKTTSVTVNLPAYNKTDGAYGTTNIYFGGNDQLIENGAVKSGYELFICGLDDTSDPVNGTVDPRAGSMALYKYNTNGGKEMVAACRRYVAPLQNSTYTAAYENYIASTTTELQFDIEFIIGEVDSYIKVMGTTLFTFKYNPDGNGFGLYTNASYPTAAHFSSLTTKDSETTTVVFNTNGGNETVENLEVAYGNKIGELPIITKDGCNFEGWTLHGNPVDENYVPGLVDKVELEAIWGDVPLQYEVWDGSVASEIAEGDGTQNNPYVINNGSELAFVAKKVNDSDATYMKAYYELNANIDLNNKIWTPIGATNAKSFQGTFNGNDNRIIGLKITSGAAVGLFGNIANAYISNLDVTGDITATGVNAGILAGRAQPSTIRNCYVRGSLTSNSQYVGGIVATVNAFDASVTGTQTKMVIENCVNYAKIETTVDNANNFIGGIVAQSIETVALEVIGCENRGNVTGTASFIGGIISIHRKNESSIIKNCYNYGDITSGSKSRITGGIAGASRARIEGCYGWELAKVNNIAANSETAKLYPETNGTNVPGGIICGQWDAAANCTSNSGFINCGMCDANGNPVAK